MKPPYLLMLKHATEGWRWVGTDAPIRFTKQGAIKAGKRWMYTCVSIVAFRIYRERSPQFVVSSKQLNRKKK